MPTATIELDRFLKLKRIVASGGEAKHLIQNGLVQVNGETETKRSRQLRAGDCVQIADQSFPVEFAAEKEPQ